jgi:cyclophilin family peptidyl-prolyl cis-trans isomerase
MSGEATQIKKRGVFAIFSNYKVFALIGVIAIGAGVLISAFYAGGGRNDLVDGSVRGSGVTRTTPEAGSTASANTTIKQYSAPPVVSIDENKSYFATIKTSKGEVRLELNAREAPQTVNNFVFLAREGFYNGVTFHRVIQDFVAQAGDPTGTGLGGPGYDLPVEATDDAFTAGTLAMAKPQEAGAPNNGSQFFILLTDEPTFEG